MSSSQAVFIKSGDQPRLFPFGTSFAAPPVTSITANQASLPIYKESVYSTFQAILKGTGAITATIAIQCTNDDNTGRGFVPLGANGPGFAVTTAVSTTLLSPGGQFLQAHVGALVEALGVPVGTTIASVTNATTAILSAAATIAATGVQANIRDINWNVTVLGTITLSSTGPSADGFTTTAPWRYVRANVTNITGAGVTGVAVNMGV